MGWDSQQLRNRKPRAIITGNVLQSRHEIVETAHRSGVFFMVLQDRETGERFITVTLYRIAGGEFYKKDMDEGMGPCELAPAKILAAVAGYPPMNDYAACYRRTSAEAIAANARAPRLKPGDRYRMTVNWRDGDMAGEYEYLGTVGRHRSVWKRPDGTLGRMPRKVALAAIAAGGAP